MSKGRSPSRSEKPRKKPNKGLGHLFERFAQSATRFAGSSLAFVLACATILTWIVTGPIFHYSDTWQLVINTGTTIITFLMVFLIQHSQNKDSLALQLKLNELVAAVQGASNRLIDVEDLSEEELRTLHTHYRRLSRMARTDSDIRQSHSIEEAEQRHGRKYRRSRDARASTSGEGAG